MTEEITFCRGGGCTAKLGPDLLSHVLSKIPKGEKDPDLLIGYDSKDDAAVYRISDDTAVVQTLDFSHPCWMIRICSDRLRQLMRSAIFMPWAV